MSRSPKAIVEKQILRWARERAGFNREVIARKIHVSPEAIEDWEEGRSYPSIAQLRKLAHSYMRPIGLFFLSEPPEDPENIKDFRRIPDTEAEFISPALRFEMRLAWERRQEALELMSDLDEEAMTITPRFRIGDDPDEVAHQLRSILDVSIRQQMKCRTKRDAFNAWRSALERKGVLVFQTGVLRNLIVDPKEARGFSIAKQPYPVIVVNSKDHPTARCFTLIHELTHVLMEESGLCDMQYPLRAVSDVERTEIFCNRVAGATLVPADSLLTTEVVKAHGRSPQWSDDELGMLARMYWVSWEVILRRLLILGRTSREYYQSWRASRTDEYPGPEDQKEPRISTPTRVFIRNGRLFPGIVLRAMANKIITSFEASDMLGAGAHYLGKIEAALFKL